MKEFFCKLFFFTAAPRRGSYNYISFWRLSSEWFFDRIVVFLVWLTFSVCFWGQLFLVGWVLVWIFWLFFYFIFFLTLPLYLIDFWPARNLRVSDQVTLHTPDFLDRAIFAPLNSYQDFFFFWEFIFWLTFFFVKSFPLIL